MTTVLLDTVGLLALWDISDQGHAQAEAAFVILVSSRARLVSTSFVLLECGNAASRRPYRSAVARFRHELESSGRLIVPTEEDWTAAWAGYARGTSADAGIVDHVSFAVMQRLGITDVFGNDRHFRAAGFNTLF